MGSDTFEREDWSKKKNLSRDKNKKKGKSKKYTRIKSCHHKVVINSEES